MRLYGFVEELLLAEASRNLRSRSCTAYLSGFGTADAVHTAYTYDVSTAVSRVAHTPGLHARLVILHGRSNTSRNQHTRVRVKPLVRLILY